MADIAPIATKSGTVPFTYEGETYQTYYKIFGNLADRTKAPLIALHGGPGLVLEAVSPFAYLSTEASIPVILYDQLGNGRSTHLKDKPSSFWTIDLFVAELENLIAALGVQDAFELAGHSWGGVLGAEFVVRRQPRGLKHLVLADSLATSDLWMQSTIQLMQTMPPDVQEGLMLGMKDPAKYRPALLQFHAKYGCTVVPPPKDYIYALDAVFGQDGDLTVANAGILKGWTIVDRLDKIEVPTLVINGRNDIAQDFVVAPFFQKIKKVKWITFEKSSHTPMFEERELFIKRIKDFVEL